VPVAIFYKSPAVGVDKSPSVTVDQSALAAVAREVISSTPKAVKAAGLVVKAQVHHGADDLLNRSADTIDDYGLQSVAQSVAGSVGEDGHLSGTGPSSHDESTDKKSKCKAKTLTKKRAMIEKNPLDSLTQEELTDLADWFKANTMFYDQSNPDFKDTRKKTRYLHEKAKEIGEPVSGE
jgi:hypothetical protein